MLARPVAEGHRGVESAPQIGRDDQQRLTFRERFGRDHGLFPKFVAYAEAAAAEENSGSDDAAGALA